MNETLYWWQGLVLGLLQGFTEYLPVSSSGHLAIAALLFGLRLPLSVDVLLHLATLLPTLWIFRAKIISLLGSCWQLLRLALQRKRLKELDQAVRGELRYVLLILVASGCTLVLAWPQRDLGLKFRPDIVGLSFLFTALLLCLPRLLRRKKTGTGNGVLCAASWRRALSIAACIGMAQGLAALPGVSRSAVTISIALLFGLGRREAGEFSFVISIPAILGALLLGLPELQELGHLAGLAGSGSAILGLAAAFLAAVISGFVALRWLLLLLQSGKFHLFAFYVVPLAAFVLWYF